MAQARAQILKMASRTNAARRRERTNGRRANGRAKSGSSPNGSARSGGSSYDRFKEFQGKRYTGMAVGRGHHWRYQEGDWIEKKVTPEKWEFRYSVPKRRKGRAPEGSGVPVGTAYHWYILADQTVTKLDANNYSTDMVGHKYKLSHKRADKDAWSESDAAQRRRLVKILRAMIDELTRPVAEHAASEASHDDGTPRKTASAKPRAASARARGEARG